MSGNLNQTILSFDHAGRSYEVDRLLDSNHGEKFGYVYDLFDVTAGSGKDGRSVTQFGLADGFSVEALKAVCIEQLEGIR